MVVKLWGRRMAVEELRNTVMLTDEDGNEVEFEFLDLIELDGEEYVVLLPDDEPKDGGEVVILKAEDTGDPDSDSYAPVYDDDTLNRVFGIFKERFADEFDFVD